MRLYITLVKYECEKKLTMITNIYVNKKTLYTNIAVNNPYDTKLC